MLQNFSFHKNFLMSVQPSNIFLILSANTNCDLMTSLEACRANDDFCRWMLCLEAVSSSDTPPFSSSGGEHTWAIDDEFSLILLSLLLVSSLYLKSEKCGTILLCNLKIILPIFLWFHFSPGKCQVIPIFGIKLSYASNLNYFYSMMLQLICTSQKFISIMFLNSFFNWWESRLDIVLNICDLHFN